MHVFVLFWLGKHVCNVHVHVSKTEEAILLYMTCSNALSVIYI